MCSKGFIIQSIDSFITHAGIWSRPVALFEDTDITQFNKPADDISRKLNTELVCSMYLFIFSPKLTLPFLPDATFEKKLFKLEAMFLGSTISLPEQTSLLIEFPVFLFGTIYLSDFHKADELYSVVLMFDDKCT